MQTDPRRRRRRDLTAAGLIALPLVGSAFVLPAVASADPAPAAPAAFVAPATEPDETAFVEAYLAAGYSFDDAVALAERWGADLDPFQVKVEAGAFLKYGTPLKAAPFADPSADDAFSPEQLVDVFFVNGYRTTDAEVLAEHWGLGLVDTKVRAGSELKTVGVLPKVDAPVADGSGQVFGPDEEVAFTAYFDAGYDYDDALALADFWGLDQPADAKLKAGRLLRSGGELPAGAGVDG